MSELTTLNTFCKARNTHNFDFSRCLDDHYFSAEKLRHAFSNYDELYRSNRFHTWLEAQPDREKALEETRLMCVAKAAQDLLVRLDLNKTKNCEQMKKDLQARVQEAKDKVQGLVLSNKELTAEVQALKADNFYLWASIDEVDAEAKEVKAQLAETNNQLAETNNQLAETNNQLAETTAQFNEKLSEMSFKADAFFAEREIAKAEAEEFKAEIDRKAAIRAQRQALREAAKTAEKAELESFVDESLDLCFDEEVDEEIVAHLDFTETLVYEIEQALEQGMPKATQTEKARTVNAMVKVVLPRLLAFKEQHPRRVSQLQSIKDFIARLVQKTDKRKRKN